MMEDMEFDDTSEEDFSEELRLVAESVGLILDQPEDNDDLSLITENREYREKSDLPHDLEEPQGNENATVLDWNQMELAAADDKHVEEDVAQVVDFLPSTSQSDIAPLTSSASIKDLIQENLRLSLMALRENMPGSDLPPVEPTLQYLTGQITFTQFSEIMEKQSQQDQSAQEKDTATTTEPSTPAGEDNQAVDIEETTAPSEDDSDKVDDEEEDVEYDDDKDEDYCPPGQEKDKKTNKPPRKKKSDLPKHLQGLMGEVHLKFARGSHDEAIALCNELIRLAPQAYKPFQALGMIYEEMGDTKKALQYYLIAAYLNPKDSEEWVHLAEMSMELNDLKQAIKCYSMAIKFDPENIGYMKERCRLHEELGDFKKALEGYQGVLEFLPKDDGDTYFELARSVTKSYHELGLKQLAIETMQNAFKGHPEMVTSEDVNLLLELQMGMKMFAECINILVTHCGIVFELKDKTLWKDATAEELKLLEQGSVELSKCDVPELLPIDLRIKLVVSLISIGYLELIEVIMNPVFAEDVEEIGDLFLDVAEAYMDKGMYENSKPILQKLVASTNYNLAAVWLKYGECLNALKNLDGAVKAFSHVVEMAPAHIGARMSLSALQQQLGNTDDALKTLSQEKGRSLMTPQEQVLLLHKCHLLHSQEQNEEFFACCKRLLVQQYEDVYEPACLRIIFNCKSKKHRFESLKEHFQKKGEENPYDTVSADSSGPQVSIDDLWDIYNKVFQVLLSQDKLEDLQELSILVLASPPLMMDSKKYKDAEFMCIFACLLNKKGQFAYNFVKDIINQNMNNNQAWNLFSQILLHCSDIRHHRFCLRLLIKNPDHLALGMLNGHNSMISGTYKHSLGEYVSVFRRLPYDPLITLCIGLNFIHLATQKFSAKRHSLLTQGLAFLNHYMDLRGDCQETNYNFGRALHQLGLNYAAVYYYKKALEMPPAIEDGKGMFSLHCEAAYNLALIYQKSGSREYAQQFIHKYCVI